MRYLRRRWQAWQSADKVHLLLSRIVGMFLVGFLALCFWNVYLRAEPTTIAVALLVFLQATGMLFNGGPRIFREWLNRGENSFQQTTTTTATTIAPTVLPVAPMPLATDKDLE